MPRQGLTTTFAMAALALPSPLVGGDRPDPGVLRADDGEYVAVTTSNGWSPTFRVLRSPDLVSWRTTGAVFRRPPRWAQTLFWAPEMIRLGSGYALFYSALPRDSSVEHCLGVATAPTPEGPWRDRGRPLRCGRNGSIDAHPTRDENGRLHLLWKSNANRFRRRTTIFAQRLREDGKRLLGRPRPLIKNDRRWEGKVVEAPTVIRRPDGYLYMLYSGNLCCTKRCRYSVGVARSRKLFGPWRKFEDNPILVGGNGWRCPGHTSVVETPDGSRPEGTGDAAGGFTAFFHAYREGDERLAGRQLLAAPLTFGEDGWPAIGEGRPPAPAPGADGGSFEDDFAGPLHPEWEWPMERVPGRRTGNGLVLSAPRKVRPERGEDRAPERPDRIDGGVLSRRVTTGAYTATTVVDTRSLGRRSSAGLSSFRNGFEMVGVAVRPGRVFAWQVKRGRFRTLSTGAAPRSRLVHLRMVARGRRFYFESSPDGKSWRRLGRTVTAPVQESARVALVVGGERRARARFVSAGVDELTEPGSTRARAVPGASRAVASGARAVASGARAVPSGARAVSSATRPGAAAAAATPRQGRYTGPATQEGESGEPVRMGFTVRRAGRAIQFLRFPSTARCAERTELRVVPFVRRPVRLVAGPLIKLRGTLTGEVGGRSTYRAVFRMDGRFPTPESGRGTWDLRAVVRNRRGRVTERCETGRVRWRALRRP